MLDSGGHPSGAGGDLYSPFSDQCGQGRQVVRHHVGARLCGPLVVVNATAAYDGGGGVGPFRP